jgi:hypothetical protein
MTYNASMLENFTLVIAGPVKSRCTEKELIWKMAALRELQRKENLKIIFSTYADEIPETYIENSFTILINKDPGLDTFSAGQVKRNTSRLIQTSLAGIGSVETEYSIKTRIELIPEVEKFHEFISICKSFESKSEKGDIKIGFLTEHYYGPLRPNKGIHSWVPDTFQIMKKTDMFELWNGAQSIWESYKNSWHKKHILFPITNEQIIGLSLYSLINKYNSAINLRNFQRYSCVFKLIRQNINAEVHNFIYFNFKKSGLSTSRLDKSSEVNWDGLYLVDNKFRLMIRFVILQRIKVLSAYLLLLYLKIKSRLLDL